MDTSHESTNSTRIQPALNIWCKSSKKARWASKTEPNLKQAEKLRRLPLNFGRKIRQYISSSMLLCSSATDHNKGQPSYQLSWKRRHFNFRDTSTAVPFRSIFLVCTDSITRSLSISTSSSFWISERLGFHLKPFYLLTDIARIVRNAVIA